MEEFLLNLKIPWKNSFFFVDITGLWLGIHKPLLSIPKDPLIPNPGASSHNINFNGSTAVREFLCREGWRPGLSLSCTDSSVPWIDLTYSNLLFNAKWVNYLLMSSIWITKELNYTGNSPSSLLWNSVHKRVDVSLAQSQEMNNTEFVTCRWSA